MKKKVMLAFGLLASLVVGASAGLSVAHADDPATVKLKQTMEGTANYKPSASDAFTVKFTQLENLGKYWGDQANADAVVAPKVDAALTDATIAGTGAKEGLDAATKTAETDYKLSQITQPGYYTYKVVAGDVPVAIDDANGKRSWSKPTEEYIMTVKVTGTAPDNLQYDVKLKTEDKLDTKLDELEFKTTLTASQNVTIKKVLAGTGLDTADRARKYSIKVTLNGLTADVKTADGQTTFTSTDSSKTIELGDNETATIKDVPLGVTVAVGEDGLPGFKASVQRGTNAATEGKISTGVSSAAETVTMGNTADASTENAFTVTNTRDDIVNTGISMLTSPFVLLLVAVAAGVTGYVVIKRRANI